MTPTAIANKYLPIFFGIGQAMNGVEHNKDTKSAFTDVLIGALTEAFSENAKLAESVAPLKDDGTRNEYTKIIADAIRAEGSVPLPSAPGPAPES